MSKRRVLILTGRGKVLFSWEERKKSVEDFCRLLNAKLGSDTEVLYATYDAMEFTIQNGQTSIYDLHNHCPVEAYAMVHFKNGVSTSNLALITIANFLKAKGIPFYNSESVLSALNGKISQMFVMADHGLPVPNSYHASNEILAERLQQSADNQLNGFNMPVIMKAVEGSKGRNNYLIHTKDTALKVLQDDPERLYMIQEFIPNDGDYRILFIGLSNPPLIFKRTARGKSHLNNTAQGGKGTFVDSSTFDPIVLEQALQAAKLTGREIGGVDVMFSRDSGQHYFLEVNSTPALATGFGVPEKVAAFARLINHTL